MNASAQVPLGNKPPNLGRISCGLAKLTTKSGLKGETWFPWRSLSVLGWESDHLLDKSYCNQRIQQFEVCKGDVNSTDKTFRTWFRGDASLTPLSSVTSLRGCVLKMNLVFEVLRESAEVLIYLNCEWSTKNEGCSAQNWLPAFKRRPKLLTIKPISGATSC